MTIEIQHATERNPVEYISAVNSGFDQVTVNITDFAGGGVCFLVAQNSENEDQTSCTISKEDAITLARYILDNVS